MNKVISNFDEAVSIIPDGASVAVYFWSFPGNPQNLLMALSKHGAKNLTLITPNFYIYPLPRRFSYRAYNPFTTIEKGSSIILWQCSVDE